MTELQGKQLARAAWLGLLIWQFVWLALLPTPYGKGNLVFALVACVPMLFPLPGIVRLRARGMIWGGYIALFLAMFGGVEAWADPPERPAALLQLVFCGLYFAGLIVGTRKRR